MAQTISILDMFLFAWGQYYDSSEIHKLKSAWGLPEMLLGKNINATVGPIIYGGKLLSFSKSEITLEYGSGETVTLEMRRIRHIGAPGRETRRRGTK